MAAPRAGAHIERRFAQKNQLKSAENVALHFRERATLQQAKSMTYLTSTRANCRRWVRQAGSRTWRNTAKVTFSTPTGFGSYMSCSVALLGTRNGCKTG